MFFSLILNIKNYNRGMKKLRENKNVYFYILILISFSVAFLHEFHECDGDGCLICLFSIITFFISNALLIIRFVPILVEKITIYINTTYSKVLEDYGIEEEKEFVFNNPINNLNETDLITFGVKIQ